MKKRNMDMHAANTDPRDINNREKTPRARGNMQNFVEGPNYLQLLQSPTQTLSLLPNINAQGPAIYELRQVPSALRPRPAASRGLFYCRSCLHPSLDTARQYFEHNRSHKAGPDALNFSRRPGCLSNVFRMCCCQPVFSPGC